MNSTPKVVNTVEAKNDFNALINEINKTKKPIIVEKRGKAVAVILDFADYQENQEPKERRTWLVKELRAMQEIQKEKWGVPNSDSVELIREMREERVRHLCGDDE